MPRIETSLDRATKEAFHNLAGRSGTTEAALLRRVISAVVNSNPVTRSDHEVDASHTKRLTVRVTPDIFEAVSNTARDTGISRPRVVLSTLRARFLQAPTLLPVEKDSAT